MAGKHTMEIEVVDPDEWPALASSFDDRDHQASVAYLEHIAADRAEKLELLAVRRRGTLVGLAALRTKRLPVVGGGIGVIAGGPLVARPELEGPHERGVEYARVLDALADHVGRRGIRLHVRPPTLAAVEGWFGAADAGATPADRSALFDPYETMVIDLTPGVDELRRRLSTNWRRHLLKAERSHLLVDEPPAAEGWRRLRAAYESMVDRKGFDVSLTPEFWTSVLDDPRSAPDFSCVVVADADTGQDLAGVVIGGSGDLPVYVLGASVVAGHDRRAGYLAQWAAVAAAARDGHRQYDLGGVDKSTNPGGWQFKDGMRGRHLVASPPLAFPARGVSAPFLAAVEWHVRRGRSRSLAKAGST